MLQKDISPFSVTTERTACYYQFEHWGNSLQWFLLSHDSLMVIHNITKDRCELLFKFFEGIFIFVKI